MLFLLYVYIVAAISFLQSEFMVIENEEFVKVDLVRSGDLMSKVVVLIGTDPYRGSATGTFLIIHNFIIHYPDITQYISSCYHYFIPYSENGL